MNELMLTVAQPFKKRGKNELSVSEFLFALSLDLRWFSPDQAKLVLHEAERSGLLVREGDVVRAGFDVENVDVPTEFRPSMDVICEKPLFEQVVEHILREGSDLERKDVISRINQRGGALSDLVFIEVVALLVARDLGVDVDDLVDVVYDRLVVMRDGSV